MRRTNEERSRTTRHDLVEAARLRFAEQGYAGTSLAQIAAAAGITTGAVYHHWENKQELFHAVVEQVHADLHRVLRSRSGGTATPSDRLKTSGSLFLRRCADPAVGRILLVDGPSVLGQERWRNLDEQWWREPTVALLREAGGSGGGLEELAVALLGSLTALGQEIAHDPRPVRIRRCQQVYRTLVDAVSGQVN
ncbi:TetR/AcrR family transcriptional regulator [Amycolatopsis sp. Poz14]|uniref:TetR/AcrR family transcriptional regulator n=1 Tax=Amycolatopsis sp. Poz14 TaxID=1447705 RepID=UPI001EE7A809|nr:TetR/AcrR family transcriptional regulator [Amycolatopsis sp. Poz14]MCG3751829.1 TetR family transcriptional regulator [Amycolatopsis sp. Poz14]